jgi:hypothetical protein
MNKAGGFRTTLFGKNFERDTNNKHRLMRFGYTKKSFVSTQKSKNVYDFYLSKTYKDKTVIFVLQQGFKKYMKERYNIDVIRNPDEAYIIEYNNGKKIVKILEKKNQQVEGTVELKLWAGPSLKREYQLVLGKDFDVKYGFCVNDFFKDKLISDKQKYVLLNRILDENNIKVLYGEDRSYFQRLDHWINSF